MKKFLNWLVVSSSNPEKISATVRGILLTYVGLVIFAGQAFRITISEAWLSTVIETATTFFGVLLTAFGLARKLYYTFKPKPVE